MDVACCGSGSQEGFRDLGAGVTFPDVARVGSEDANMAAAVVDVSVHAWCLLACMLLAYLIDPCLHDPCLHESGLHDPCHAMMVDMRSAPVVFLQRDPQTPLLPFEMVPVAQPATVLPSCIPTPHQSACTAVHTQHRTLNTQHRALCT